MTFGGETMPLPSPSSSGHENPIDQEGTIRCAEAQLDRFMFKVVIDGLSAV